MVVGNVIKYFDDFVDRTGTGVGLRTVTSSKASWNAGNRNSSGTLCVGFD